MEQTKADLRTWAMPVQPNDVKAVRAADGSLWRITDRPDINPGEMMWVEVASLDTADPWFLSWGTLLRIGGPLTEVVE
jgi:hypothetical protein